MKIKKHKYKSKLLIVEDSSILVLQKKRRRKDLSLQVVFLKKENLRKRDLLEKFMKKLA